MPSKVEEAGSQGASSFAYQAQGGEPQLKRIVAPAPPGLDCTVALAQLPRGCRVLGLHHTQMNLGALGTTSRLTSVRHVAWDPDAATPAMKTETVAQFGYYQVADGLHIAGRLREAWDPRITPALKETYTYEDTSVRLSTITPPGEAPWSVSYFGSTDPNAGKVSSISRTAAVSGLESWRMAWNVPLSTSSGGPYDMTPAALDVWGQTDVPTDATAILPPNEPGTSLTRATIRYVNQDGRIVNTVRPGGSTATTEYNAKGSAIRELSAANRARVLVYPGNTAAKADYARTVDSQRVYSPDGLELREEFGPQREVKLDSGQIVQARSHTVTTYDEGYSGDSPPHLPTTMRAGARVGSDPDVDVRTTTTSYNWALRKPTQSVVDAGSGALNITRQTAYNTATGLETSSSQPKSNGSDAGTTQTLYYTADASSPDVACRNKAEWFNLVCKTKPAAQPGTAGLPDLPVTTYTYNRYGKVLTAVEQVADKTRTTTTTYDDAGRKLSESITSQQGSGIQPSGLVAAYGFEEGTGGTVADGSGNANSGTISGATWTTSGKYGKALTFDGVNDRIAVSSSSSLQLTAGVTLSAWVKPAAAFGYKLALGQAGVSDLTYGLYSSLPSPLPSARAHGSATSGATPVPLNQWSHLAMTYDGAMLRLYVGGTQAAQYAMSVAPTSSGALSIGGHLSPAQWFNGALDEVRVYNRALTAQEVQGDRDTSVATQTAPPPPAAGEPVLTTTYGYNSTTGRPTTISNSQGTITTQYDNVGRITGYTDSGTEGVTSTTTYDNLNRPVTTNDGKGTQTHSYDNTTGLLTSMTDSQAGPGAPPGAGTFTASYDADGRIVSKTYPNGMKADTTYDPGGSPIALKYTKTSNCSSNCVWIDEQVKESIHGQWRTHYWELSSQEYTYDKAGRLTASKTTSSRRPPSPAARSAPTRSTPTPTAQR